MGSYATVLISFGHLAAFPGTQTYGEGRLTIRLVWSTVNPVSVVKRADVRKRAPECTLSAMSTELHLAVKKEFGERLKIAREQAGYDSGAALALMLGVPPARYRFWGRGQAMPD